MQSRRSKANRKGTSGKSSRRTIARTTRLWKVTSSSPLHTDRLGQAIGSALRGGETLALIGPLGAGKTALVRGIAAGLGAPTTGVSSPTFVFIHEYQGRLPLAHVDLYRLNSTREMESVGLTDYLSGSTVVVIEWADKYMSILPEDHLEIRLRHRTVGSRSISLTAKGPASVTLLAETKQQYLEKRRLRTPESSEKTSS
jgi:tRNA threonylcarbamoyladenosine biosynthesis protein TsaE